jgi:REP element-mobilizing transposase RayT
MPNYFHGASVIVGAGPCACPKMSAATTPDRKRRPTVSKNRATTGGCPYGRPSMVLTTMHHLIWENTKKNMKYDSTIHRHRSIRLQGYDYSRSGAYFVTICVQNRKRLFGDIKNGEMRLNDAGKMIQTVWNEIPEYYPGIETDEFVIMPNHFHGITVIAGGLSLPNVVHRFKTMTTKRYTDGVKQSDWPPFPGKLWQRNYWEHIIRNESELNHIREYIRSNHAKWELDKLYINNSLFT